VIAAIRKVFHLHDYRKCMGDNDAAALPSRGREGAVLETMLVIASRGSQLALWQAHWVQQQLAALGYPSRIDIIKTTGDKITDVPLAQVGGKGLFTKEIEEALLAGRADLAVHSLKDLPTELPAGLVLAATPEREDPRDALVGRRLADLPGAPSWAPVRCGARRSCARCGPICGSSRCAAIWIRACASWMKVSMTPSCWRRPV
jgi:hypothetical protein